MLLPKIITLIVKEIRNPDFFGQKLNLNSKDSSIETFLTVMFSSNMFLQKIPLKYFTKNILPTLQWHFSFPSCCKYYFPIYIFPRYLFETTNSSYLLIHWTTLKVYVFMDIYLVCVYRCVYRLDLSDTRFYNNLWKSECISDDQPCASAAHKSVGGNSRF